MAQVRQEISRSMGGRLGTFADKLSCPKVFNHGALKLSVINMFWKIHIHLSFLVHVSMRTLVKCTWVISYELTKGGTLTITYFVVKPVCILALCQSNMFQPASLNSFVVSESFHSGSSQIPRAMQKKGKNVLQQNLLKTCKRANDLPFL